MDSREKERGRETGAWRRRELKGGEIRVEKGEDIEMEGQEETWSIIKVGFLKRKKEEEEGELKERSLNENGVRERKGTGIGEKKKADGVERRLRHRGAWTRKGRSGSGLESDRNGKVDGKERKWERQKNWENMMYRGRILGRY
jgi:hypothetical protein